MLKRIFYTIAFLLICASAQAQEGIFVAADCAIRIPSPVANKVICFDQTLQVWRGYNGEWITIGGSSSGGSQTAAEVPFTPAGDIASSNVQSAIAELDTEKQPLDSELTAIAAVSSNGLIARTGAGTAAARSVVAGSTKLSVTNGNGVSGNVTLDVSESNVLLQNLGGAVTDPQVPDLDQLSTGLTPSRCVETDASGLFVSAADVCGSGSGVTVPGSDGEVIFNDSGVLGAEPSLTFDKTTKTLSTGDCTTNCITDDPSEITGQKTRTRLNATGYEAASDGKLTAATVPSVDSSNRLIDGIALSKLLTRSSGFIIGADTGDPLTDAEDQDDIFINRLGTQVTITEVYCRSNAGSPTIQLQKDDGSPADILSAASLTCTTAGASSTSFTSGENVLANGNAVDYLTVSAGGTAARITVVLTYEVN